MRSYHNFPLIKLCLILQDESKCTDHGVKEEEWKKIRDEYVEARPSPEMEKLVEGFKSAFRASVDHNRFVSILDYIIRSGTMEWEFIFQEAGLKYTGDHLKDAEYLKSRIEKARETEKILTARHQKLEEEIEKKRASESPEPLSISAIYKTLASLERAGANIPDYEKFTCGAYDAWTEILKETNKSNG